MRLAGEFAIVLYDKRGHGLSDVGQLPSSIEDHATDLAGLLDLLSVKDAVICGLSVGGLIAQSLYHRRPDLIRALILCDTAHKIGTAESWNARIAAVEQNGIASIVDAIMELVHARLPPAREHRLCRLLQHADAPARRGLCRRLLRDPRCRFHRGRKDDRCPDDLRRRRSGWLDAAGSRAVDRAADLRRPLRDHS
ncbi:alpha/beta fold hydrolase [Rhizobium laguerreae]|uniref:alpha/beta fold hydrolase n=1 Tax=Rhizobium laguerreae TaxID=1076926 RepID=UPI003703E1AF